MRIVTAKSKSTGEWVTGELTEYTFPCPIPNFTGVAVHEYLNGKYNGFQLVQVDPETVKEVEPKP